MKNILEIKGLRARINKKAVLNGIDLKIPQGQIHVLMGPNGSGKSTLARLLIGIGEAEVEKGRILFKGKEITKLSPEQRAKLGIFLANQYPIEVPGVNLSNFLRIAYNSKLKNKKDQLSPIQFRLIFQKALKLVGLSEEFMNRNVNEGFSGGEKKKSEILQMAVLKPELVILDETDSGLDIDALKQVFSAVNKIKQTQKNLTLLIITHYERIFKYIKPDKIHIIDSGRISRSGNISLLKEINEKGFKRL